MGTLSLKNSNRDGITKPIPTVHIFLNERAVHRLGLRVGEQDGEVEDSWMKSLQDFQTLCNQAGTERQLLNQGNEE